MILNVAIQFKSVDEFLLMGTHGMYVWSAWGVVFFCLLTLIWSSYRARRKAKRHVLQYQQRESRHISQNTRNHNKQSGV